MYGKEKIKIKVILTKREKKESKLSITGEKKREINTEAHQET
jgi:hypothetical protein